MDRVLREWQLPEVIINHYGWDTEDEPLAIVDITGFEIKISYKDGYTASIVPNHIGFFNPYDDTAPTFYATAGYEDDGKNQILRANFKGLPSSPNKIYDGLYTTTIEGKRVLCIK